MPRHCKNVLTDIYLWKLLGEKSKLTSSRTQRKLNKHFTHFSDIFVISRESTTAIHTIFLTKWVHCTFLQTRCLFTEALFGHRCGMQVFCGWKIQPGLACDQSWLNFGFCQIYVDDQKLGLMHFRSSVHLRVKFAIISRKNLKIGCGKEHAE